jgi:hypothetical protein
MICDYNTDLGVFTTLKERRHSDEPDIVVPHDSILGIVSR